ncbi:acyl-CoA dehydrogenase [Pseudomonas sp. MPR-ANC1]|uniref:DUF6285 domain-containing protein n=1 Tax=Pseudomonas sp. MPR-ANC1 TaxID=2075548 RepID=UPI000CD274C6|nr:DUF6285 domain-containing protein [Pseudomonas sp. MPR-ANC1]POA48304.1 acyl-CoA dehydrogenase [Pseudomonas sp. MPR-ANC1]
MTQPNAAELLDIARLTLLEQISPGLPGELRYPLLMIANAMAIAARESRSKARLDDQEQTCLAALVDEAPATLPEVRRRLAVAIRAGAHDAPPARRKLVGTLRDITLAQLAISNPKAVP